MSAAPPPPPVPPPRGLAGLVRAVARRLVRPHPALVAAARVSEAAIRRSPLLRRLGRRSTAVLARLSPEARAFVRIRLMRLV